MPSAAPLSDEQQRRVAAVMALVREIADVADLDDLVSALIQAAAVWYDIDARGFRRAVDGNFTLAAALPGATPTEAGRVIRGEVAARYPQFARVTDAADLDALGSHEASGDLVVLPLPSGAEPLWMLTFAGGSLADAEQVLRGLSPVLDMVIDRWRLKLNAALHAQVLAAISRAFESGGSPVAAGLETLRRALDGEAARLSIRDEDGAARTIGVAGLMPEYRAARIPAPAAGEDVVAVSFALGGSTTALLELAPSSTTGAARVAAFAEIGRAVFLPWLSGALMNPSPLVPAGEAPAIPDLASRIRDEITNAARFGRGTAVLSIAFLRGAGEQVSIDEARRSTLKAIACELRRDDAVGWIAGADLAVLVTDVTPDVLPHASERVRRILAGAHLAGRAPAAVIGTAVFPADGIFADQLMDVARSHAARQIAAITDSN